MGTSIEQDLRSWSKNVLEVPSKHLNGLPPCPYARKAWLDNKVKVVECDDIFTCSLRHVPLIVDDEYDLVICASYEIPDIHDMEETIDAFNLIGARTDVFFMPFHPDYGAEEAGLDFLYETDWESDVEQAYCMIFIQSLSKVDDASLKLEETGYYQYLPADEYKHLVLNRRKRRHGDETKSND